MTEHKEEKPPAGGGTVKFNAGPQLWAYLEWLSRHTLLGDTPGKVAQQVLVQRLSEMKQEGFTVDLDKR